MLWKNIWKVKFYHLDLRQTVVDVSGQEIMTSDKVTPRTNAVITRRVVVTPKSASVVDDSKQAAYREAQQAFRAAAGTINLDPLLSDKETGGQDLKDTISALAKYSNHKLSSGMISEYDSMRPKLQTEKIPRGDDNDYD